MATEIAPEGWTWRKLGEISRIESGATPATHVSAFWGGDLVWITPADLSQLKSRFIHSTDRKITKAGLKNSSAKLLPAGNLVISSRAPIGYLAIPTTNFCTNQGCKSIVFDDSQDAEFHYYNLSFRIKSIKDKGEGTTFAEISKAALSEVAISIPEDRVTQSKIAEVLATVDVAIEQTEALIAKYERIKAGLMHDLLTRGIDAHGRLRDPATHAFKDSPLGKIPVEWVVEPLALFADVNSGLTLGRRVSGPDTIELPYLRVANVQDGYLDLSDVKTIRIHRSELARYRLQIGDVLMNEGGDFDKLGRGTVWQGQISPCLHQNHVFRVRPNHERLLPDYLALVSSSPYGKKFFVLSSKQSTNLASINSTQLKRFPIPLPEMEEQKRIVQYYEAITNQSGIVAQQLSKLRLVKSGLMQDLLTGRVSVAPLL